MVSKAHKQIMIRLYDEELLERLTDEYANNKQKFKTQNNFFIDVLRRGVADEKSEVCNLISEQNAMIKNLTEYIKSNFKGNAINIMVVKNILSEMFNLLFASADYDTQNELMQGTYQFVDDRFVLAELESKLLLNKSEVK